MRSDLKPARISSEKNVGCSQAAKCPPFWRFSDLAIASQLLDDLQDIEEDARLDIAATTFLGSRRAAKAWRGAGSRRRVLTRGMVLDGGADAVIRLARNHAQRAWRTAKK